MLLTRREVVLKALFGPGLVGLRALLAGVPPAVLLAAEAGLPMRQAWAAEPAGLKPQFTIFSTSAAGDPINCNVPGTYEDPSISHAPYPDMAATKFTLGTNTVTGAQVWSTLPASMRAQTCFFHHSTYTVIHPDQTKVLGVQGATQRGELLPSILAKRVGPKLGTIRNVPINLNDGSHGVITCDGVLQPSLTPTSLASLLGAPSGTLGNPNLLRLRDTTVDTLNAWAKQRGGPQASQLLDDYALGREQVRTLQDGVVGQLASIRGNDPGAQLQAAVILFKMKVAPVVMVGLPFGGDNHTDFNLFFETQDHIHSIGNLAQLPGMVQAAGIDGQVTFCLTNVFGRRLADTNGRQHHDRHAVSLLIGNNVRAGVVGGVGPASASNAYEAMPIVSATGAADVRGDVSYADTFASYAKTLATAAGMNAGEVDADMRTGTTVAGALVS